MVAVWAEKGEEDKGRHAAHTIGEVFLHAMKRKPSTRTNDDKDKVINKNENIGESEPM